MKRDASFFEDKEPVLIYIAKRLSEALRLEEILNTGGVDYGVEADEYRGGVIFNSVRAGAFFYVDEKSCAAARELLQANGFKPRIEENPGDGVPAS
jgi:hypothetical protein